MIEFKNYNDVPKDFTGVCVIFDKVNVDFYNIDKMSIFHFKNGSFHRDSGPAVISPNGDTFWFKDGNYHREGGPAIDKKYGYKQWNINGELHREDGAAKIFPNGVSLYYYKGKHFDNIPNDEHWFNFIHPRNILNASENEISENSILNLRKQQAKYQEQIAESEISVLNSKKQQAIYEEKIANHIKAANDAIKQQNEILLKQNALLQEQYDLKIKLKNVDKEEQTPQYPYR